MPGVIAYGTTREGPVAAVRASSQWHEPVEIRRRSGALASLALDAPACYCRGMAFEPDIIVTGPESADIALVVEVKANVRDLENSERQLKRFMVAMQCPVGLLVTPQRLWLYRDRYLSSSEDSIERVGEFLIEDILDFEQSGGGGKDELAFERLVQSWLEGLGTESGLHELPVELRRAVELYIAPAISQGTVRAGHPRSSLSAWWMKRVFYETNWVVS